MSIKNNTTPVSDLLKQQHRLKLRMAVAKLIESIKLDSKHEYAANDDLIAALVHITKANDILSLAKSVKDMNKNVAEREWVCNECNTANFTQSIPREEIEKEMHSCINCGGFEFHLRTKK